MHASHVQVAPDHSLKMFPSAENAASFEALQHDVSGMKRQVDLLCRALLASSAPTSPVTAAHLLATSPDGRLRKTPVSAFELHNVGAPPKGSTPSPHPQGQWVADDINAGEDSVTAAGAVAESSPGRDGALSDQIYCDDDDDDEAILDGGFGLSRIGGQQQASAPEGHLAGQQQQQQPRPPQQPRPLAAGGSRGSMMTPVDISFTPEPASLV